MKEYKDAICRCGKKLSKQWVTTPMGGRWELICRPCEMYVTFGYGIEPIEAWNNQVNK